MWVFPFLYTIVCRKAASGRLSVLSMFLIKYFF